MEGVCEGLKGGRETEGLDWKLPLSSRTIFEPPRPLVKDSRDEYQLNAHQVLRFNIFKMNLTKCGKQECIQGDPQ